MSRLDRGAGALRRVPREWIAADGMNVTEDFLRYALPLIQGEAPGVWSCGVPEHLHL